MIGRSLVALSFLGAAGMLVACGDSGTSAGGGDQGGSDPQGGTNSGAGNTGGQNVGAGSEGGNGGNAPNDCGNGTVDGGEDCDGANLDGATCESEGFVSGTLACAADCSFDTADCAAAACGDGAINGTEDCDGTLLGGETCQTQGFDSGTLACSNTCSFNTKGCSNITCGDGTINGTEECDGTMLGANTCATEGFDGGTLVCTNCQLDTAGCLTEDCVDNVDNDADATIDCLDTNCAAECADACNTVPTITDPGTETGTTTGHADVLTNSCGAALGGTSGPEVVYQTTAAMAGFMHVTLTSATADHGISAWTGCPSSGTEIPNACSDIDFGNNAVELISLPVTAGQVVHLMVDGFANASAGTYTLDVETVATATCGDGFVDGGEFCDDGNTVNDATCNATCTAACGDGVCTAAGGESSCTCAADCPDDVNTCSGCDCTFAAANPCQCDDACIQFGDCCANETASCGVDSATFNIFSTGAPVAFADGTYNGTIGSMVCVPIPTVSEGTVTSVNSVTIAAAHTWLGDVTFKLISPAGTAVTLMSLPGTLEALDNGNGSSSESSNLAVANPITFIATAATSAESMGSTIGDAGVVCAAPPAGDGICQFIPNAGAAAAGTLATGFTGQTSTGTWQLCAGDSVASDTGTINSVTVNLTIGG